LKVFYSYILKVKDKTETFHIYYQKPYEQIQQIDLSIQELEQDISFNGANKKSTDEVLELAKNLFEKWSTLTHTEKREVIETITEKIIVDKDEININLYKIIPDSQPHHICELGTSGQHTLNGVVWTSKRTLV